MTSTMRPSALRNARDFFVDAPDEVSLWLVLTHVPPQPPFPEERWGTPVLAVVPFCTDLERGPALLEPLTSFGSPFANLHGPLPYTALQSALDDVRSARPPVLGAGRLPRRASPTARSTPSSPARAR